jgi:hypothetical protein
MRLFAYHSAYWNFGILAVIVSNVLTNEAEAVLAFLCLAALDILFNLIYDLTQHQSDIILNFLFLLSLFDEFGHLIWIKLSVYRCLELWDVLLYH